MAEKAKFGEGLSYGLMTVDNESRKPKGKVLVVITNRSSYVKVKTVIEGLLALEIDTALVLAGSLWVYKYGMAGMDVVHDFPGVRYYRMDTIIEGDSNAKMADSVGILVSKLTTVIEKEDPDLVVTIADRFETIGTAIAASYMNVDLVHIQGGEVSGSIDDKVRDAVTMMADWHFPATENAKVRIQDMFGFRGSIAINNFGCPSMDLLARYQPTEDPNEKKDLFVELHKHGTGYIMSTELPYIIVMFHPDTREEERTLGDLELLIGALKNVRVQKVVFWPNIDSTSDEMSKMWRTAGLEEIRYVRHLRHNWFARLLWFSSGIVGNSSAGIREASFYGTPSVSIGSRQMLREHGRNVVMVDARRDTIGDAIRNMLSKDREPSTLYGTGDAGNKIANKISSILEEIV